MNAVDFFGALVNRYPLPSLSCTAGRGTTEGLKGERGRDATVAGPFRAPESPLTARLTFNAEPPEDPTQEEIDYYNDSIAYVRLRYVCVCVW